MTERAFPPRQKLFILLAAHLALLAIVFQTSATGSLHGASQHGDATSLHPHHCHAASATCADSTSVAVSPAQATLTPLPPEPLIESANPAAARMPEQPYLSTDEPPRAA